MATKVEKFFADLDAGLFEEKLSSVLSDVAAAVVDHGTKGEVTIKLSMSQIGNGHQVAVHHSLEYKRPTTRGHQSEKDTTSTPMHVGTKGALSFFPENQTQMFDKRGRVAD